MAKPKKPLSILINKIETIRGNKLPKNYRKIIKEHLDNNKIHKHIFDREDYDTLAMILSNYIRVWFNNENNV